MEIEEAYKILGLSNEANEDEVNSAYKELIKKHHPDKTGESEFSYSLNEARDTIVSYLASKNSRAVALIVTTALSKYREADKREAEIKNELDQIINELSKRPKSRIERLRNYLIVGTFIAAIIAFITNSSNSLLSLSSTLYPDKYTTEDSLRIVRSMLNQDSISTNTILGSTRSVDSVYKTNQERIDTELKKLSNEKKLYELDRKRYKEIMQLQMILISSFGVVLIAYMQMKLKTYESNLESFRVKIDNKSKLKKLLRLIITANSYSKKLVPEYLLQHFIKNLFYETSKDTKLSYELDDAIALGKKLEITDLEKIIILKFSEKNLIEESSIKDDTDETYYSINL